MGKGVGASGPVFVDSSAWIAFFSALDQNHREAVGLFRRAVETKTRLVTTNLVLAEIHGLLLFRAGMRAAAVALEKIESSPLVSIEFPSPEHHRRALERLGELAGRSITYTDGISFAMMEVRRCEAAITFDHDFESAGFERWRG